MPEDEAKDDQAIGHTIRLALSNPRVQLLLVGMLLGGGGLTWMQKGSSDTTRLLKKISKDVVMVKIQTEAIMKTMPPAQQAQAQKIVDLQLAALKMAREAE